MRLDAGDVAQVRLRRDLLVALQQQRAQRGHPRVAQGQRLRRRKTQRLSRSVLAGGEAQTGGHHHVEIAAWVALAHHVHMVGLRRPGQQLQAAAVVEVDVAGGEGVDLRLHVAVQAQKGQQQPRRGFVVLTVQRGFQPRARHALQLRDGREQRKENDAQCLPRQLLGRRCGHGFGAVPDRVQVFVHLLQQQALEARRTVVLDHPRQLAAQLAVHALLDGVAHGGGVGHVGAQQQRKPVVELLRQLQHLVRQLAHRRRFTQAQEVGLPAVAVEAGDARQQQRFVAVEEVQPVALRLVVEVDKTQPLGQARAHHHALRQAHFIDAKAAVLFKGHRQAFALVGAFTHKRAPWPSCRYSGYTMLCRVLVLRIV